MLRVAVFCSLAMAVMAAHVPHLGKKLSLTPPMVSVASFLPLEKNAFLRFLGKQHPSQASEQDLMPLSFFVASLVLAGMDVVGDVSLRH